MASGSGFRVEGSELTKDPICFRVSGVGFKVEGLGLMA